VLDRVTESLRAWTHAIADASPGAHVVERDGVSAVVTPALPERSVANCVVYSDVAALESNLDDFAAAYDDAGVRAWTVWAHENDRRAQQSLTGAGHVLDAEPMAMVLELGDVERPAAGELDLIADPDMGDLGAVVTEAYGFPGLGEAVPQWPPGYRGYVARVDGEPAVCAAFLDVGGDATVTWVGTVPEARGRGLANRLMRHALADAQERGCEISTLVATKLGYPVYARLGYRDLGRMNMWERRRPA
jgi:ribosomal protein S18 acetylase RimI-like enzyme